MKYLHAHDLMHRDIKVHFLIFSQKIFSWMKILMWNCVTSDGQQIKLISIGTPFVALISIWPLKWFLRKVIITKLIFGLWEFYCTSSFTERLLFKQTTSKPWSNGLTKGRMKLVVLAQIIWKISSLTFCSFSLNRD